MELVQVVAEQGLFAGVDHAVLTRALSGAEEVCVARGQTIYTPRHFRRCLGLVCAGRVQVSKETLIVSSLFPGELFGAAALFQEGEDYATTLTALTDCRVVLLPQEAVAQLLRESPKFAENYVRYLSGRIRFLSRRLDAVSAGSAEGKLAQYLLAAADADGQVTISATRLSATLGVGRATLYRAFEALERENGIEREGKVIRIRCRETLRGAIETMSNPERKNTK